MMIADVKGKLPELQNWEDYLTSCVFSSFKYLGSEYLEKFLKTSRSLDNDNFDISIVNPTYEFWPRDVDRGRITEPDLIIFTQETVIVIEAKFYSGKSGIGVETDDVAFLEEEEEVRKQLIDQLAREYYVGKKKSNKFFVVFVTADSIFPKQDIDDTLEAIKKIKGEKEAQLAKKHIFWTKWSNATKIMEDIIIGNDKASYQYVIAFDLLKFLEKRELTDFRGFEFLTGYLDSLNITSIKNIFYKSLPPKFWSWLEDFKSKKFKINGDIFYSKGDS